jgi:putative MFS transporter
LQFLAVPLVAFLAWLLVPNSPLGLDGWRWVVLIGSAGAIFIWFIRLSIAGIAALAGAAGRAG